MGLIDLKTAIKKLQEGQPVAVPTETVYGLAAPISKEKSLRKIFEIKKRPLSDPLIVHVSGLEMALNLIEKPHKDFQILAEQFWPGPLTLVTKKNPNRVNDLITSSLNSVAIRCPDSKPLLNILESLGPLAAPSANIFKSVSPTKADHVLKELPSVDVLEGGSSSVGLESTIYDIHSKKVLRPGAITAKQIEECLKTKVIYSESLNTPGSEKDHYQPNQAVWVFESEELLEKHIHQEHCRLPQRENAKEASKHLYQDLRDCDTYKKTIFVLFKPEWREDEAWRAFENRLLKASTQWFSL